MIDDSYRDVALGCEPQSHRDTEFETKENERLSDMAIRIINTPPGEAPEYIRQAWIGITLPTHPKFEAPTSCQTFGVSSGPQHMWITRLLTMIRRGYQETGYVVDAQVAFNRLEKHSPEAAEWWNKHTPHLFQKGQLLMFRSEACEYHAEEIN